MTEPWFVRAFAGEYLDLYSHRDESEAQAQVAALLSRGILAGPGPILDLACGAGRHLRALRANGLHAFGLDLSADLLARGKLSPFAVRGDMRQLPFANESFTHVLSLFTSFGYFETDAEHLDVLREVRRVLKDSGSLVLDLINPRPTLAALQPESTQERDGVRMVACRRFDARARRLIKDIEYSRDGRTSRWQESVRLFEPDELEALLASAGLFIKLRSADFAGAPFEAATSPRQLVVARQ